jgi:nitronate monooxygenase
MSAEVSQLPLVAAPMAGGPTTPALVAAAVEAGAFAFVAAGYRTPQQLAAEMAAVRAETGRPFGVNLFVPSTDDAAPNLVSAYAERIGADPADARWSDDDWEAKLELVVEEAPAVVSFTFGCPPDDVVAALHARGSQVWCTVTSAREARIAATADALVVQGAEAGGHQGSYDDTDEAPRPLLDLLRDVRDATEHPLVAAGGIGDAARVQAVLEAGAAAAQVGTALMLCPEAGTSPAQRAAFGSAAGTSLTRAFTGRRARGIVNRFMLEHDSFSPRGYPQIHFVTAPIRAAARRLGDAGGINLWAGTAYRRAEDGSASELVERWAYALRE